MNASSASGPDSVPGHAVIGQRSDTAPREGAPSSSKVLVLGATGFLGQALVERLRRDGLAVRALVRETTGRAQLLARQGVELMQGDLTDTRCFEAALEGIGHVFHLARSSAGTWDDCLRLEVEPTRQLALACTERRIPLYYASSIAIYDGGRAGDVITEATPPSRQASRISLYARTKVANELLLAQLHRDRGLNVVVFRPGIVIGAGGSPFHPGLGTWPSATTCHPWSDGRHVLPFVLSDDCADAMALAMRAGGIAGHSFNLVGEPCLSGNGYLDALERAAGSKIRRVRWPTGWLFARSAAKWALQTLARAPERRLPSYRYIRGLGCRASYKPDLAKQRLGWAPAADVAVLIERGIVAAVRGRLA